MLGVFVVKQKEVDVMETMVFGRQVVDGIALAFLILGYYVYTNIRILVFEFGDDFQRHWKVDSIKVQRIQVFGVTVNGSGVVFWWVQARQDGVFEAALIVVFTATCFSNGAVMGSLDVRLSVCDVGDS